LKILSAFSTLFPKTFTSTAVFPFLSRHQPKFLNRSSGGTTPLRVPPKAERARKSLWHPAGKINLSWMFPGARHVNGTHKTT
jgi:hypothetical protein